MRPLILSTVFLLSHIAHASSDNVLNCSLVSGTVMKACEVQNRVIDPANYPVEVLLNFEYSYDCATDYYLAVKSDSQKVDLSPPAPGAPAAKQSYSIQGKGPFTLYDTDPDWTSLTAAKSSCRIGIPSHSVSLSSQSLANLEAALNTHSQMSQIFQQLRISNRTVGLIRNLIDKTDLESLRDFWITLRDQIQTLSQTTSDEKIRQEIESLVGLLEFGEAENPSLEEGKELAKKLDSNLQSLQSALDAISNTVSRTAADSYGNANLYLTIETPTQLGERLKQLETEHKAMVGNK